MRPQTGPLLPVVAQIIEAALRDLDEHGTASEFNGDGAALKRALKGCKARAAAERGVG